MNVVCALKSKTSCDKDNINMVVIKQIINEVLEPLTHICNASLSTGIFPSQMKDAKVVPLFKANDAKLFNNYRPVSILPQFSKILEKLINNRIIQFIKENKLLTDVQYGFRSEHSTALALTDLTEVITKSIDDRKYGLGIFIDLKKAFDTVNHSILLDKLNRYGIRGSAINLLRSYLTNRQQYVMYDNVRSSLTDIRCGVPQGSILGPTLFLLYINDMKNISKLLKFIIFADDTNLFYSSNNIKELQETVNNELKHLVKWFKVNKLSLNVTKTNYMLFTNKKGHHKLDIKIEQEAIMEVKETKFLGVIVDNQLNWKSHIAVVENKISKSIGILYRVKAKLNKSALYTLYCALVLPYLDYCCEIWGNTFKTKLNKVTKLQKRRSEL